MPTVNLMCSHLSLSLWQLKEFNLKFLISSLLIKRKADTVATNIANSLKNTSIIYPYLSAIHPSTFSHTLSHIIGAISITFSGIYFRKCEREKKNYKRKMRMTRMWQECSRTPHWAQSGIKGRRISDKRGSEFVLISHFLVNPFPITCHQKGVDGVVRTTDADT